ncbi:MAG: hypothetical protein FJ148_04590 [Deltaproteobacteria bacterium]|nr:hypothetical protein [Deltaproteobacteria bacterium]
MASDWWRRLPDGLRREYERSDTITRVPLPSSALLAAAVIELDAALHGDDLHGTEHASQLLAARICHGLKVPGVQVRVAGVRPHDQRGELHGLYTPGHGTTGDRILVWMRTAKRGDVVRTKTFLRTLLHEVCHHLDFVLFSLPNSFHSRGFYQRESSLLRVVVRGTALARPTRQDAEIRDLAPHDRRGAPGDSGNGIELLRAAAAAIAARSPKGE